MLGNTLGGRYEIINYLGGGGFGTTFVAEDKHLPGKPLCVVKQLKPKAADDPLALQAARRLFNREAQVLYLLGSHNQIPRLFAHFEQEQEFYLVQEFIEGHELRQELPIGQKISEGQVLGLLREILEVLVFVHQQDVIHRDIKPSNLIRRKQDGKIVLIDFGAVKQIGNQLITSHSQTSLTIAVGSLGYMPSEQIAGKPRFSSDIYAVGMMGLSALTGLSPRDLPEDSRTSEIIWRDRVEVHPEFAKVLDRMVSYDFRDRYQSAAEVLENLNSINLRTAAINSAFYINSEKLSDDLPSTEFFVNEELRSERGVNYTQLQYLLATRNWKEADIETKSVMLKVADREQEGSLRFEDIEKFPCVDLRTINQLWVKYSQGRFGFSVQHNIWHSAGGEVNADAATCRRFGNQVGWYVNENWLGNNDLSFTQDAPVGHLPVCDLWGNERMVWGWVLVWVCLFFRVETCNINY